MLTAIWYACAPSDKSLQYIDESKPDVIPKLFAKEFISKEDRSEFGSVFNKEGTAFYYGVDVEGKAHIEYTELKDGVWTTPAKVIYSDSISYNDPMLSPDEQRLYYISNKPKSRSDTLGDYDIWYSIRKMGLWSDPINAGKQINTAAHEYYISFSEEGTMYFASNIENINGRKHNFDIYKSEYSNSRFLQPQKIDTTINTRNYEADVFVAPDESYIIFCSARRSGLGRGDLYISFKDENDRWTEAINMGEPINSEGHELCPYVTQDGAYFFYTSNQDIYWVSTKAFDEMRDRR